MKYITSNQHQKEKAQRAFTLIELLVVIAIISLLSSVVLASLSGARESAQVTKTVSDLNQFETAMTMWMQNTGRTRWPEPETDFGGSSYNNNYDLIDMVSETELGDYLTAVPDPSFGSRYFYYNRGTKGDCGLWDGANIQIPGVPQEKAREMNDIIDGDGEANWDNCGKFRYYTGDSRKIFFQLSNDSSF